MKNPIVPAQTEKVTISEQGRAAARKWKPGDKPFVQFLAESEASQGARRAADWTRNPDGVDPVDGVGEEGSGNWYSPVRVDAEVTHGEERVSLDIGSRLEFQVPPNLKGFIIRSTTKVNLGEGPQSCETRWEVYPDDEK